METTHKTMFVGQRADEKVLYFSRRHWFPMAIMFLRNVSIAAIWGVLIDLGLVGAMFAFSVPVEAPMYIVFLCILLMVMIPTFATTWTIYYLTLTVITDNRLVKIVQKGLFQNYTREVKLTRLQDTSYTMNNWLQTMMNYGTLVAHAASGEEGKFQVRYLPEPRMVHQYINSLTKVIYDAEQEGVKALLPLYTDKERWKE